MKAILVRLPWVLAGLFSLVSLPPAAAQGAPAIRTLYLIRHGYYETKDRDSKAGNPLLPLGREQASLTGDRLAGFPIKFSSITTSEFTRARETGDIIAAKVGLSCLRDGTLNECTPVGTGVAPTSANAEAEAQLARAWQHYATPASSTPSHDLLVCHGNVIRWFICRALGADSKQWRQMDIANCSITIIEIKPDGTTRLLLFNDAAHVPVEKQTWAGKGPAWPLPSQPKSN